MITGKNYIGTSVSGLGTTFKTFDPKKNIENDTAFFEASEREINNAVSLATTAFIDYKKVSGIKKSNFLNTIADEILKLDNELIETYTKESGLPESRAIGERSRTIAQLRSFANLVKEGNWVEASIDTAQPNRKPLPKADIRKMLIPVGPVVVFGASNFPLAFSTAGGDTASALASGCPVIVKSHPMHAGTGELVASAIVKAAKKTTMPNGVFSNLNGSNIDVGKLLVMHKDIKSVVFTGSFKAGKTLFNIAGNRPEPIAVFAEMGSINPIIILPKKIENDSDKIVTSLAGSITLGAGQFCTNPGLILGIKSEAFSLLAKKLADKLSVIDASCMLHPNIKNVYKDIKKNITSQDNVSILTEKNLNNTPNYTKAQLATVNGDTFLKNPKLHQEVFGPFSLLVQCKNKEELLSITKTLEGQLTATILGETDELMVYSEIVHYISEKTGRIIFNEMPTGVEVCSSMHHGGPYPATTDSRFTSVGTSAIKRFVRPLCYQNWPEKLLPKELKNTNPLGILRLINGSSTTKTLYCS